MLSDDDIRQIKQAASKKIGSSLDRLNPSDSSIRLEEVISRAIAAAIAEYDKLRTR